MEHIVTKNSLDSKLHIDSICSIRILNILKVTAKTDFSKIAKCSTLLKGECSQLKAEISGMKECQICNEQFDHGMHQPAKANCGHILYCKSCLTAIGNSTGKCPACRQKFQSKHVVAVNLSFV